MSGANYEYCPVCDQKALYVGDEDLPEDVLVMHVTCLDRGKIQAAAGRVRYDPALRALTGLLAAAP